MVSKCYLTIEKRERGQTLKGVCAMFTPSTFTFENAAGSVTEDHPCERLDGSNLVVYQDGEGSWTVCNVHDDIQHTGTVGTGFPTVEAARDYAIFSRDLLDWTRIGPEGTIPEVYGMERTAEMAMQSSERAAELGGELYRGERMERLFQDLGRFTSPDAFLDDQDDDEGEGWYPDGLDDYYVR